jgi:hypothetical protein
LLPVPVAASCCLLLCRGITQLPCGCPAQGLAEVVAVMGPGELGQLLPELLAGAASRNAFVREGHLTLFR